MKPQNTVRKLIDNEFISGFIQVTSIVSFLLANLAIFFSLAYFFEFTNNGELFVLLGGLLLSFVLVKTGYLVRTKKEKSDPNKREEDTKEVIEEGLKIDIGWINTSLILLRLLFFNVLNDLFIVLVTWTSLFWILAGFKVVTVYDTVFPSLVSFLTIIGILSGIFQFYIQSYKENVSNQITTAITKHLIKIMHKASFKEFLKYLEKEDNALHDKVQKAADSDSIRPALKMFYDKRSGTKTTNTTINLFPQDDAFLPGALENLSSLNKGLKKHYTLFFDKTATELKKEIDSLDISELQRTLFPNIVFFDEVMITLLKSNFEMEEIDDPQTFEEYRVLQVEELVSYLIEKLLGAHKNVAPEQQNIKEKSPSKT